MKFIRNEDDLVVESKLTGSTMEVIENLFKIYVMPNAPSKTDFIYRIWDLIHAVPVTKKGSFLSYRQIFDWTWGRYRDLVTVTPVLKMMDDIEFTYESEFVTIHVESFVDDFRAFCRQYFSWVASNLDHYRYIGFVETQEFLEDALSTATATRKWRFE